MRKLVIFIFLAVFSTVLAQEKRVYFFSDFVNTAIQYKGGQKFKVKANYDVANRKMMYMQGDQLMELTDPQLVDTIVTDGYAWVLHDGHFCQVVDSKAGNRVLLGWHIVKMHEGYVGAFGISQVPSRKVKLNGQFGLDNFTADGGGIFNGTTDTNAHDGNGSNLDVWRMKNQSTYYFNKDGREYALKGMKSVYKAFPEHKEQIKQFVHDNHLDMMTAENAFRIIDFLITL
ncbi:MAG: hypothetical protein II949_14130 [Prevotella sp.]|nr:hypothetical protein [Prevotella sp.]